MSHGRTATTTSNRYRLSDAIRNALMMSTAGIAFYGAEENKGEEGEGDTDADGDTTPDPRGDSAPPSTEDATWLRKELDKARKEAAANRKAKKDLERIQNETMSEAEKEKARQEERDRRATQLEQELQRERVANAVFRAAATIGFADPSDAHRLIDESALSIDEETGRPDPASVKSALDQLAKEKPYLLGKTNTGSGSGTNSGKNAGNGDGGTNGAPPPADKGGADAEIDKYTKELLEKGAVAWPT